MFDLFTIFLFQNLYAVYSNDAIFALDTHNLYKCRLLPYLKLYNTLSESEQHSDMHADHKESCQELTYPLLSQITSTKMATFSDNLKQAKSVQVY